MFIHCSVRFVEILEGQTIHKKIIKGLGGNCAMVFV